MRLLRQLLYTLLCCVPLLSAQTVPPADLTLKLSTGSSQTKLGSPVLVDVAVQNVSNRPIKLTVLGVPRAEYRLFKITLMHNGTAVQKTNFHHALDGDTGVTDPDVPLWGSSDVHTMLAHSVEHVTLDLAKLFDITEPGQYVAVVKMEPNADLKEVRTSNELTLMITP